MKGYQGCTMSLVPLMLTSKAAARHSRMARSSLQAAGEAPVHWPAFRDLIERRFGIPYRGQDAHDRFDNLQRAAAWRTLGPQWNSFFLTWARCTERDLVHQFQRKLTGTVRFELERAKPRALAAAFELAESIERAERLSRPAPSSNPRCYAPRGEVQPNAMHGGPAMWPPLMSQEQEELTERARVLFLQGDEC